MGGKNKKKFIDKKRDVLHTFKIVHRSQRDPLLADENAPKAVLVDIDPTERQQELHKYGIYFDDDYDYLQHLRGVKEAVDWEHADSEVYTIKKEDLKFDESTYNSAALVLPSSVFESYVEEPVGLLNRAAPLTGPRPELDPDVVAALDHNESLEEEDVFDPEDEEGFPDNFVSLLNSDVDIVEVPKGQFDDIERWLHNTIVDQDPSDVCIEQPFKPYSYRNEDRYEEYSDGSSQYGLFLSDDEIEEIYDDVTSLPDITVPSKAATSMSSRTSASASTLPRSELLSHLDEKFEYLYNKDYSEDKIGSLDDQIIEGPLTVNSEIFQQAVEMTKTQFKSNIFADCNEERDQTIRWIKETMEARDFVNEEEELTRFEKKLKCPYDCESIISTYSNTQNHPHLIDERDLFKKGKTRLTAKALKKHDREVTADISDSQDPDTLTLLSCISAISIRPKNESQEERRERKNALKELRRERRKEKKSNKLAFKEEMKRQVRHCVARPKGKIVAVV